MRYLKAYEEIENKLKKYIYLNLVNLIIICEVIKEYNTHIRVQKLYTYDIISKTMWKNNEEPTTLIYDNFTKENIGDQSDNLQELLEPLEFESNTNKYNL
jgi:hypothetical protein